MDKIKICVKWSLKRKGSCLRAPRGKSFHTFKKKNWTWQFEIASLRCNIGLI